MTILFVGLGNPGEKYKNNRHNVGFILLNKLAQKLKTDDWEEVKKHKALIIKNSEFMLVKPQTFMNDSGSAVSSITNFYKIDLGDIYVVHDDLDLKLGEYKIQQGVGPKVHNGVNSVEEKLGNKDFWRVRIGVDNRVLDNRIDGEDYVLQNFSEDEIKILDTALQEVVEKIINIINS